MTISKDKTYKTRSGLPVRIYATDGFGCYPVHGAVQRDGVWTVESWSTIGAYGMTPKESDLVEVKPRHKRTFWLNVYSDGEVPYKDKISADVCGSDDRVACLKIDLDFEEGEGL